VLDVPSVLELPQLAERGLVRDLGEVDGVGRSVSVVRSGFRLASGDPGPDFPPPRLGADNVSVLGELGYGEADIARLREEGAL
jgi:CoA:oxalate CoA-transferase